MPIPQFKVRKLNGVTDIRMADDRNLRKELCRTLVMYAPLLEEEGRPEPSFDALKSTPEASAFLSSAEGMECSITLQVRGMKQAIIEKAVLFVDPSNRTLAVSRWTREGGTEFSRPN
jgi:hypothetical protein